MVIGTRRSIRPSYMPKYTPRAGDGCILWLPGQDDPQSTTLTDKSGNGTNMTISGATWARSPSGLWVLTFDGTNDTASHATFLDTPPANVSFELWWSPTVTFDNSEVTNDALLYKTNIAAQDGFVLYLNNVDGALTLYREYNNDGPTNLTAAQTSWTGGQWYQTICTFDGSTWRMYNNAAVEAATLSAAGFMRNGTADDFIIGAEGVANYFKGQIALLRFYNRALSASEIAQHYRMERHLFN